MTPLTLSEKQQHFTVLVARLIIEATSRNLGLTFGEAYRSPEEAHRLALAGKGIEHSLHTQRLAIDLNLFVNGVYQTDSAAYTALGEWWEAQSGDGIVCCWGGRFTPPDGNHMSVAHDGRK